MKKKLPFIIVGGVVLFGLMVFGYVKLLQMFDLGDDKNTVTLNEMSLTLPDDYSEFTVADRDFTYTNGTFVISGNAFNTNYFMERGTSVETKEAFAQFIIDMNPEYNFGDIKKDSDCLYFTFDGIINNESYSKIAAVFEQNKVFYFIQIECYTSSEYLLEDEFKLIVDTVEFE